ncbi:MAG: glycoside hydrolase family 88 protein [Prevotella sp.]|nr:glycoside hydrolase family 88 protein [Prevotella sp.]
MRKTKILTLLVFFFANVMVLRAATYQHYSEWMAASEMQRTPHPYNLNFSSWWPQWSYQVGVELDPMLDVYLEYQNAKLWNYLKEYPAMMVQSDGSISGYSYSDFNLDNVRPGHFLFRMYQQSPAEKELKALNTLFKQLENQPRTENGVWWHKEVYHWQVWLDGVFMGMPFYVLSAPTLKAGQEKTYYDDAVDQMTTTDRMTYDEATDLWKHAWDETHTMFWADAQTGQSQHTWGRALGWYFMALLEVLEALPEDYARRGELLEIFQHVAASVVKYQDESGVWYDVLDVDDPRNYLEATCSSMFCYCLLKGVSHGWLADEYKTAGIKAFRGIVTEFVKENCNGTISLEKCCEVSGLGPENKPQRDGSFEYYMSENVRDNDPKGVGPFMWAALEMERLGYTVENLFNEEVVDGIAEKEILKSDETAAFYSLAGVRVGKNYRGIKIKNGRVMR